MKIDAKGRTWYKGNLHMHTTLSDGAQPPEKAIARYKEKGYDFLALTDHWKPSATRVEKDFILLSGCEYDVGRTVQEGIFHIVGVGMDAKPALSRHAGLTPQGIINGILSCSGIAILAHPAWSLNRPQDVLGLKGLSGTEIYNTISGTPWNARPYSGMFVDALALEGMLLPCIAADDTHRYDGDETRSFVVVQADAPTPTALIDALRKGRFYASQGPELLVWRDGGKIRVQCSPVRDVIFYTDAIYAEDRVTRGENIREASYSIQPQETFVRVEAMDAAGNCAWSSPMAL